MLVDLKRVRKEIESDTTKPRLAAEKRRIEKRCTESLEAYNLYLQGNYYTNKRTPQGLNKGIEYFNEAIRIDPEFALAYTRLAKCYDILGFYGYLTPTNIFPKAKAAAMRAREIDDTLAEAHTEQAVSRYMLWDWSGAEREYRRALVERFLINVATICHCESRILCGTKQSPNLMKIRRLLRRFAPRNDKNDNLESLH